MPQLRSIPHFDTSNANTHSCLLDFGISQWNPILPWWSLFYSHLCCLNTYEIPSLHYSGWWFQPTLKNDGVSSSIGMMTFHSQLFMESHVIQSCSSHHQIGFFHATIKALPNSRSLATWEGLSGPSGPSRHVRCRPPPEEQISEKLTLTYPAWETFTVCDIENGPVEIVDLPIKNGLCQNNYWKWQFIVDLPIENCDFQ